MDPLPPWLPVGGGWVGEGGGGWGRGLEDGGGGGALVAGCR